MVLEGGEFSSGSQWARDFSEEWWAQYGYCLSCASNRILPTPKGTPSVDFLCPRCDHPYQLKANLSGRFQCVPDGAYSKMIECILASKTPTFLLMRYTRLRNVLDVTAVHRTLVTSDAVRRRNPTLPKGRSKEWIGCDIILREVPPEARIGVIRDEQFLSKSGVRARFAAIASLDQAKAEDRSWTVAVLNELHRMKRTEFTTEDAYQLIEPLAAKFPDNHHVAEKIRQQLQILVKRRLLVRVRRGLYRFTS
jgi:type II restriction enzyme